MCFLCFALGEMAMQLEETRTRTAKIWMGNDGIIRKVFVHGAEETMKDALESGDVIRKMTAEQKKPLLVDFTPVRSIDAEARAYYAADDVTLRISAVAGITASRLSRVIGNFFMGFNKPQTPARLFNSQEDAIEWLKQFL
jgi:hypothetical protein